jgi:membrane protein DedA with SNARE-associated domain
MLPGAHEKFRRYGLPVLCVAKFFPGVDGVIPPLLGAEGVSLASFLALDVVGSFLWSASFVGLGYIFRTNWILRSVGTNISELHSLSRLGFRSLSTPAGVDWL